MRKTIETAKRVYWQEGVPVALVASSLAAFGDGSGVGIRLIFQNLAEKTIKTLYFSLICLSVERKEIRRVDNLSFLDLSAGCTETFSADKLVRVPDNEVRGYEIIVERVIYDDGFVWENKGKRAAHPA